MEMSQFWNISRKQTDWLDAMETAQSGEQNNVNQSTKWLLCNVTRESRSSTLFNTNSHFELTQELPSCSGDTHTDKFALVKDVLFYVFLAIIFMFSSSHMTHYVTKMIVSRNNSSE